MWLGEEQEPGFLAQPLTGWADLPHQPSPSPALANTLSPTHAPGPLISAPKHGCGVSQDSCRSLTEKEGASEAQVMSFSGPNVVEEVSSRRAKESYGDQQSCRGLLANVLQISSPINSNGRHRHTLHQHRDTAPLTAFPAPA